MVKKFACFFFLLLITGAALLSAQAPAGPRAGVDWPGFRGIAAGGVDDAKALPLQWSVPDAKLVKWRVPVSGLGHSSPVVWGDLVCTASAISGTPDPQLKVGLYGDIGSVLDTTEHKWIIACFDKAVNLAITFVGRKELVSAAKAKRELGWTMRPINETILETGRTMIQQGVVPAR